MSLNRTGYPDRVGHSCKAYWVPNLDNETVVHMNDKLQCRIEERQLFKYNIVYVTNVLLLSCTETGEPGSIECLVWWNKDTRICNASPQGPL